MPSPISSEVKAAILAHHQHGLSGQQISDKLKEVGMRASKATVNRLLPKILLEVEGCPTPKKRLGTQCKPSARSKATIAKVRYLVDRPDPFSVRAVALKVGVSLHTVWKIVHKDLKLEKRTKITTHALSDKQVEQRVVKGPRLLKHICGNKWKNIVTCDEAWLSLVHVNGRRRIYYQKKGEKRPESYRKYYRQGKARKIMFVGGITSEGTTGIRFVPPKTKVNSEFYVTKWLKPLFQKDIPKLFGDRSWKIKLHHDSAPSHTPRPTTTWLKKNKINYIPAADWPANSPDLSPMDYSINGIFKRNLWKRKAKTLNGLIKVAKEEWAKLSKDLCCNVLGSWEKRVRMMIEQGGLQIEHVL